MGVTRVVWLPRMAGTGLRGREHPVPLPQGSPSSPPCSQVPLSVNRWCDMHSAGLLTHVISWDRHTASSGMLSDSIPSLPLVHGAGQQKFKEQGHTGRKGLDPGGLPTKPCFSALLGTVSWCILALNHGELTTCQARLPSALLCLALRKSFLWLSLNVALWVPGPAIEMNPWGLSWWQRALEGRTAPFPWPGHLSPPLPVGTGCLPRK